VKTSIVILTRDRLSDLRECLHSISAQTALPDEVILVDNSLHSATFNHVRRHGAALPFSLVYLRGEPSLGTASARNWAIDHASGEVLFFLDDDTVLTDSDYLETIVREFEHDSLDRIGGVSAPAGLVKPERPFKTRARIRLKALFLLDSSRPGVVLPSGFRSSWPTERARVQCLQGCAMAFRSSVFADLRFDPRFEIRPYAVSEDQDLSYRVSLRCTLLWITTTRAWHKKTQAGTRLSQYELFLSIVHNHHYFMRKNLGRPINHVAFWWAMVGVFLYCLTLLVARPSRVNLDRLAGFCRGIEITARASPHAPDEDL
jgi:GT2 family glycosyltransferase